jgi:hypothetical protein
VNNDHPEPAYGVAASVERLAEKRWRYEVARTGELPSLSVDMRPGIEIQIELPDTPVIHVVRGGEVPQLEAQYILVQQEVVAENWRRGWTPIGGWWDSEVYLRERNELQLGALDGDPVVWGYPRYLSFEQTGSFSMHVTVEIADE